LSVCSDWEWLRCKRRVVDPGMSPECMSVSHLGVDRDLADQSVGVSLNSCLMNVARRALEALI
jgi:hypothetical protein